MRGMDFFLLCKTKTDEACLTGEFLSPSGNKNDKKVVFCYRSTCVFLISQDVVRCIPRRCDSLFVILVYCFVRYRARSIESFLKSEDPQKNLRKLWRCPYLPYV